MVKEIHNFGIDVDKKTLDQFKSCYSEKYVVKAALMPDAHLGYVAPVGAVLVTKDYVVPSWVGFDIGCGVVAVKIKGKGSLGRIKDNLDKIYAQVNRDIPMGVGRISNPGEISEEGKKEYEGLVENFRKREHDKELLKFIEKGKAIRHIGSLGSGNHFIEIDEDDEGYAWIVIHSGSRGVGHRAATKYMKESSGGVKEFEETYPIKDDSEIGKEYLNLLDFGLGFALLNRMEMVRKVVKSVEQVLKDKIKWELWVNKNHNHALKEKGLYVHRKGATPAKRGERGVIPANMKDGSYLVEGKGNSKFLSSSSHGAGRALSRKKAKEEISMEEFKESMEGIKGTVNVKTLDEAPRAYKDIGEVMDAQKESVKIVKRLKPILNWKGD